jgi:hypothetical protein
MHGAKAPQVLRMAKERLIRGADWAIDYLLSVLEAKPPCETCGRADDPRLQVRVSQILLDRAGLGPMSTVEIDNKAAQDQAWSRWLTESQLNQIAEWILEAKLKEERQKAADAALLEAQLAESAAMDDDYGSAVH